MKRILLLLCCFIPVLVWSQKKDSIDKLLKGKIVCGLVRDTNPKLTLRLSCGATVTAGNQPLIILDGLLLEPGSLSAINPNTIDAITIMKGAEAGALFGSQAAAGVIIITSKKQRIVIKDSESGETIEYASVKVRLQKKVVELVADSNGVVYLTKENFKNIKQVEVSSVGYQTLVTELNSTAATQPVALNLIRKNTKLGEVVITASGCTTCRSIRCGCFVKWTWVYPDSKFSSGQSVASVAIYPNPVQKGGWLTIVPNELVSGDYQIFSSAGTIVHSGIATISSEQPLLLTTASYAAGSYILRLADKTTNKSFTQKFIVQ